MNAKCLLSLILVVLTAHLWADSAIEGFAKLEKALDFVQGEFGSENYRQQVLATAAEFRASQPESGYSEVVMAEYLSTFLLGQDGQPREVFDEVMRLSDSAITFNPDLAHAYVPAARAAIRAALFSQAQEKIDKALSLDPDLAGAVFLQAELKRRSGNPLAAVEDYQRFIALAPTVERTSNGYYWLGLDYLEVSKLNPEQRNKYVGLARESYQKAVDLNPDDPNGLANFAIFLNEQGDFPSAADYAQRALNIRDFSMAKYELALAQYQMLSERMNGLQGQALMDETNAIFNATRVSVFDATHFSRHWPVVQARMQPLADRYQLVVEELTSNPEVIWRQALSTTDPQQRNAGMVTALRLWGEGDVRQGLKRIEQLDSKIERTSMVQSLMQFAGSAQPELVLEMVEELTGGVERRSAVTSALTTLAHRDLPRALQLAEGLDLSLRAFGVQQVLVALAATDPGQAADLFAKSPYRSQMTSAPLLMNRFADNSPAEALAWAEATEGLGSELWTMVLGRIAFDSPDDALLIVANLPGGIVQEKAFERVLNAIAATEPERAAKATESLPEGSTRTRVAIRAAGAWSRVDPIEALGWVLTQPDSIAVKALPDIASKLAVNNLELAAQVPVDELPEFARSRWVSNLVFPMARQDAIGTLHWLKQFEGQIQYQTWRMQVLGVVAKTDPLAALDYADEAGDQKAYSMQLSNILRTWAASDGPAAATWLTDHDQGTDRLYLYRGVAETWYRNQPLSAEHWVMSLTDVECRDGGILGIMQAVDPTSPETDRLMGLLVQDNSRKSALVGRIMALAPIDVDAAKQLLSEADFDKETRKMMEDNIARIPKMKQWQN